MYRTTCGLIHADASFAFHGLRDSTSLVASQPGTIAEPQFLVLTISRVARMANIPVAVADVVGAHSPRQTRGRYRIHHDRNRMHPVRTVPGTTRRALYRLLDSSHRVGTAAATASAATAILSKLKSPPASSDVPVRFRFAPGTASWSTPAERRTRRSIGRERIRP